MKKNKFKLGRIILVLAVFSFLIATVEGSMFYSSKSPFFRILLVLQNSINAFCFKPSISINDAMNFMISNESIFSTVIGYAYGIAVFTAPYCTIAVVYKFLEKLMHIVFIFRRKKNAGQIVIFGYNDDVKHMIYNFSPEKKKQYCIHIVTDKEITAEESYRLEREECRVHYVDVLSFSEDNNRTENKKFIDLLKKTNIEKANDIILFEESTIKNFSILQIFALNENDESKIHLKKSARITCRCESPAMKKLITDYYDNSIKGNTSCYDLSIVSIPELQVHQMYEDKPLHEFYKDKKISVSQWHTHLMIIGFGSLGEEALIQAMNLGVVHEYNDVIVDIFDCDIDSKYRIFSDRLSSDTFDFENNSITMKKEAADGLMKFNFYDMNVRYKDFTDKVRKNMLNAPYTYVVIAIDDVDTAVGCAINLKEIFEENGYKNVPVMIRMDSDRRLANYINIDTMTFEGAQILEERKKVLNLEMIIDNEIDAVAKEFNHFYNNMSIVDSDSAGNQQADEKDIDDEWNSLPMFKRESSKALAYHKKVKEDVFSQLAAEEGTTVSEIADRLVGTNGSLLTYTGTEWKLNGTDNDLINNMRKNKFAWDSADLEHRRWCCFMASQGWRYGEKKNEKLRKNQCLVTEEKLIQTRADMVKYDLMPVMYEYKNNFK